MNTLTTETIPEKKITLRLPFTAEQERRFNDYCRRHQKIKSRFVVSLILREIEQEEATQVS